ncbi:MAG: HAD-IA family hydrolase, partial [Planctomycetota bacterium]|nr:HAD-IA family hydrolase [Planctomycetota bacterium]
IIKMLAEEQGIVVDVATVAQEKESRYVMSLDRVQPILPVTQIVHEQYGKLPMGVGSGATRDVLLRTLGQIGLGDRFDCIVASEDTQRHKPDPDVFLRAAELLDVQPSVCCVYEDSDLGIEAARRAGMTWVDVRDFHVPQRWT